MRWFFCAVILTALVSVGCEAKSKVDLNKKFSDEEQKAIQAEDKKVEDEESQGSAGKKKAKK